MTIVLPRLDRAGTAEMLGRHLRPDVRAITEAMPDPDITVTYPPVSGARVDRERLLAVRQAMVELAREHGMPDTIVRPAGFDGRAAHLIHELLPVTPHEASHEEVWSYLTCCWLLDVAVWRFGAEADERRFIGNVNRNTFRRLWWRAEILGSEVALVRLGEDELVNIMERPTIAADRRLARAVASTFLARLDEGIAFERMMLMREAMKRLLRLTPFVAFTALDDSELQEVISDVFDAAAAGLAGVTYVAPQRSPREIGPADTTDVVVIPRLTITSTASEDEEPVGAGEVSEVGDFETVARAAVDIARRTGRVTNAALREVAAISPQEARDVFQALIARGELDRRGVKRGTHYVVPSPARSGSQDAEAPDAVRTPSSDRRKTTAAKGEDSPLRRLLRRGR